MKKLLLSLLLAATLLWGQGNTATIVGTVTDQSGGVMPGTDVSATNINTNVATSVSADANGNFRLANLQPGVYRIEAQSAGFKRFLRTGITLQLDRQLRMDVTMEPGALTESITVTTEAPLLQTETGAISTTMESQLIASLPLLGRNPQELKALSPGVMTTAGGDVIAQGGMIRKDPYYIDGAHSSKQVWSGTAVNPNPDVVSELKVMTNSFSAEYGQASGAVMVATTKSGTNEFHGTLFEFLRNEATSAGNFYTHEVPKYRKNTYGGTIGGPIIKNKTFFFFAAQLSKSPSSTVFANQTLPIAAFRDGDFSRILGEKVGTDVLGRDVFRNQIFDPATQRTVVDSDGNSRVIRDPFPGNKIPEDRFNPVAVNLQSLLPLPQTDAVSRNYNGSGLNQNDQQAYHVKIDHVFNDNNRIMGRYSWNESKQVNAMLFNDVLGGGGNFGTSVVSPGKQLVLNYVKTLGATATNDMHVSYFNVFPNRYPAGYGEVGQADYGIQGMPNADEKLGTPLFEFNGTGDFASVGSPAGTLLLEKQVSYAVVNITSLIRGKHTIKFGGEARYLLTDNIQPNPDNGRFSFNNLFTNQDGINNTGYDYASFLLGLPQNYTYTTYPDYIRPRSWVFALFVQDDIRLTRNLTVNLGLRWDAPLYWTEKENRSGIYSLEKERFVQFGEDGFRTSLWEQDYLNIGPRIGLAWTPTASKNTVIRTGYGLFTLSQQGFGQSGGLPLQPIFADSDAGRYAATDQINPRLTLDQIPYERADITGSNAREVSVYDDKNPIGYFQQWNFNIQQQVGSTMLEVGYAGSKGTHLPFGSYDRNVIGPDRAQEARGRFIAPFIAFPQFPNGVNMQTSIGSQYYHSLQLKAERRLSAGLTLLAAYTFQKTMSVGDGGYRDPLNNRDLDRGVSSNSAPHRFTIAYTYQLPFGSGRRWLKNSGFVNQALGGWEISGITTMQSGTPLTFSTSTNSCVCGVTSRPNVAYDPQLSSDERTLDRYFDVDAFSIPEQYTIGNAGRGLVYGPGLVNFDVTLGKRFFIPRLPENSNFELRAEAYNLTNTPYFNNPNTQIGGSNAGRITSVRDTSRRMQLALKFNF